MVLKYLENKITYTLYVLILQSNSVIASYLFVIMHHLLEAMTT